MPFILRHEETGEVASGIMKNVYDLDYFGARWWEREADAVSAKQDTLLRMNRLDASQWTVTEIDERKLKVLNVKLNNDANRRVFLMNDGSVEVRGAE